MQLVRSKSALLGQIPSLVAGVRKHFAGQTLVLEGVSITAEQLIQELTAFAPALLAANAARSELQHKVRAADLLGARANKLAVGLRAYLRILFGSSGLALTDFDVKPKKRRRRSRATQLAANAKAKATREARNTLGKRQKAKVKGVVPPAAAVVAAPRRRP